MKLEVVLSNAEHTVSFVHVAEFGGTQTTVDLKFLKQAIKTLDDFAEKGLTPAKLTIGIEETKNDEGILIFFLDEKGKTGIAIPPLFEEAWHYFECVRCGRTLRTTVNNPSLHRFCGGCKCNIFREIPKVEYEAANGRFEIPK